MRPVIYDFAMTLDGFIARTDGSADGFTPTGAHVDDYLQRLQQYDTVVMGRNTYEFGYEFGLTPGERAYEHMDHYIFSDTLKIPTGNVNVFGRSCTDVVRNLKDRAGNPVYLCGGGKFAGCLLEQRLIDELVVKLNPVLFGDGIKPFGACKATPNLELRASKSYDNGVALLHYDVEYDP